MNSSTEGKAAKSNGLRVNMTTSRIITDSEILNVNSRPRMKGGSGRTTMARTRRISTGPTIRRAWALPLFRIRASKAFMSEVVVVQDGRPGQDCGARPAFGVAWEPCRPHGWRCAADRPRPAPRRPPNTVQRESRVPARHDDTARAPAAALPAWGHDVHVPAP